MKKPYVTTDANKSIIIDLGAYSMIFTDKNKIRFAVPITYESDSIDLPTEEAAAAEFARIRAALLGEEQPQA